MQAHGARDSLAEPDRGALVDCPLPASRAPRVPGLGAVLAPVGPAPIRGYDDHVVLLEPGGGRHLEVAVDTCMRGLGART